MELTLFVSKVTGDEKNCSYPYKVVVNNPDELKDAVRFDHVCAEYRNGYRRNSNFVVSDCAVMDCDNDASDDPEDWITPEALIEELDDVSFAVTFSRHHMKSKNGKTPRPKFHVYFKISEIRDPDAYKALKERIQQEYPFFDDNALDAGRFIYGSRSDDAVWHEGNTTIDVFIAKRAQQTSHVIPAGKRNATLSRFDGQHESIHRRYLQLFPKARRRKNKPGSIHWNRSSETEIFSILYIFP